MSQEKLNNDWVENFPAIKSAGNENPFSTPENYFENLVNQTSAQQAFSEAEKVNNNGFNIPEGYFENLADTIKSKLKLDLIRSNTDSNIGMSVAPDYFATSKNEILKLTADSLPRKKVFTLFPKSIFKYAAAASVIFALSVGLYLNKASNNIDSRIGRIPEAEIINYLQVNSESTDDASIIENLEEPGSVKIDKSISEDDIKQYINTTL
jgi:hypothetical protein